MAGAASSSAPLPGILGDAQGIINVLGGLFGTSSRPQTDAAINGWVGTLVADPSLTSLAGQTAMLRLRCWAGDQTVITPKNTQFLFGNGNVSQGCGCETSHGCRQYAQAALTQLATNLTTATVVGQQAAAAMAAINNTGGQNVSIVPVPGLGNTQNPGTVVVQRAASYTGIVVVIGIILAILFVRSSK